MSGYQIIYSISHRSIAVNKNLIYKRKRPTLSAFPLSPGIKRNRKLKVNNLSSIVRHSEECYNSGVYKAPHPSWDNTR